MTVAALIERLQTYDGTALVAIRGECDTAWDVAEVSDDESGSWVMIDVGREVPVLDAEPNGGHEHG